MAMVSTDSISWIIIAILNLWIAWRYSQQPLGQDEGIWLLWGFTGAVPYRDHVDCKPPGIHLWLWLLAQVTRRNLTLTKFLHHALIGVFALAAYQLSGNLQAALLFTALAQSAWLTAFHAWLESISSGFLLLALLLNPWPATFCVAMVILFNLKLGPSGILYLGLNGWWPQLGALGLVTLTILILWRLIWPNGFRDVLYGTLVVPYRMGLQRKKHGQSIFPRWDYYFAMPLLVIGPALASAILAYPSLLLWSIAALYIITNSFGRVWRPYHWIPLAAFVAAAMPPSGYIILITEWLASGLYIGNVVRRIQPQVAGYMEAAKVTGERLRNLEGTLWVNNEFTQIYVYARKRPAIALVEQVEIRHVVPERRTQNKEPAPRLDLVILGPGSVPALPSSYQVMTTHGPFTICVLNGKAKTVHS